ncbi:hypothetical protein EII34_06270 [Arachnia propionica]|uniref:Uncharacterized protein n=1 Tax=Arachnia propionica TaxID=1750 RepID=A0A3P1T8X1_9ACTN|nr:hypothetical protein [Arachnia propionica]RRD05809.1 hypothetical protein EII34_06270 [Arachnia propionica]
MSLNERLERIAGGECDEPLYLTRGRGCMLPTRGQQLRQRLTRSGAVTVVILAGLLGLTLALGHEPRPLPDPLGEARQQYYLSTTAISVNEGIGAAMWAREHGLSSQASQVAPRRVEPEGTTPVSHTEAMTVLSRNRYQVTFSGRQRVWLADAEGALWANDVRINEMAGQGAGITVLDADGQAFSSWFVPTLGCCGLSPEMDREFHRYTASQLVAGRETQVLEARRDGVVVSRWWVDAEHDVVLWFERYDTAGKPTVVAGFLEITFGVAEIDQDAVPALTLQAASSADRAGWCHGLTRCPMSLAGLPLVAYGTSGPGEQPWQRLVYSDGVRTLSVSWTPGVIGQVTRMDDDARGQPHVSVWQAGDGVISVATADSRALLVRACDELPGERASDFDLGDRFTSGLWRLLGIG